MNYLPQFPDKYFELAIVDPPYGIGESGGKNKSRGKLAKAKEYKDYAGKDLNSLDKYYFDELIRVSKNQIIWGANHFISKIPYDSSCWIVWDKVNEGTDFADCELAWTSFNTAVRKFTFMWNGMLQGKSISEGYWHKGTKHCMSTVYIQTKSLLRYMIGYCLSMQSEETKYWIPMLVLPTV